MMSEPLNPEQFLKAESPMFFMKQGSVNVPLNPEQPQKAEF